MAIKYSGDLSQPIPCKALGLLASETAKSELANAITREKYRRMLLLFDAHGVSHGDWKKLCFALAESHVPGLKIAKGRSGRKQKWTDYDRAMLVIAVDKIGPGNISKATEQLSQMEPWKSMLVATKGAATLRDEYHRADPRMVAMARDAERYDAICATTILSN